MALEPHVWTRFSTSGNNCVEVMLTESEVLVRNSRRHDAGTLSFTHDEWDSHTQGQKLGVFDLPG